MRIREGDPLEIYTDRDGGVIFKKYSLMGGVSEFAGQLCETIGRTAGKIAVITDRDNCVAVTGAPRREIQDKQISPELERLMEGRQIYQHKPGAETIPLCADGPRSMWALPPPSCPRAMCWAASSLRRTGRASLPTRSTTSWPRRRPPSWENTWRANQLPDTARTQGSPLRPRYSPYAQSFPRSWSIASTSCRGLRRSPSPQR